jgi:predicted dinucleotide-binding enzyme
MQLFNARIGAMKIGIVGAGQIGGTLAQRLVEIGHNVAISNSRGPETLFALAAETGATPVFARDALRGADLAILTIPLKNVASLPRDLFREVPNEVPVIDTCNYFPRERDGLIQSIEDGMPESRWVEDQIGHSVIKAFNNIYASHIRKLGVAPGMPARIALPVAGDDATTKAIVLKLVEDLGFDAVDAGSLDESWRQQPGTPVYGTDFDSIGVRQALSRASRQRSDSFRAAGPSRFDR